jgi:hypothetical protein
MWAVKSKSTEEAGDRAVAGGDALLEEDPLDMLPSDWWDGLAGDAPLKIPPPATAVFPVISPPSMETGSLLLINIPPPPAVSETA